MAEAEDVIADAARHATVFARDLWRRHRPPTGAPAAHLLELAPRLDLLIEAVFGRSLPIRVAQVPAPPTLLSRLARSQGSLPIGQQPLPTTDGSNLWLPATLPASSCRAGTVVEDAMRQAVERYRLLALMQAMRATRGSADAKPPVGSALRQDLYLLLEAHAVDVALMHALPGLAPALAALRADALDQRPPLDRLAPPLQTFERLVRTILATPTDLAIDPSGIFDALGVRRQIPALPATAAFARPRDTLAFVDTLLQAWPDADEAAARKGAWLWRDLWTGELRQPPSVTSIEQGPAEESDTDGGVSRGARLQRRPEVRDGDGDEDEQTVGAFMVQTAVPQEKAEDPMGLQRPTDRDSETAAEEFADALSELAQARLVSRPGKPREILLSDDPPPARPRRFAEARQRSGDGGERLDYPEWDWRTGSYRNPGATVWLLPASSGPQRWIDDTLAANRGLLHQIRRRFETLRAQRVRLHRQLDGDDIDWAALIDSRAALRAGGSVDQRFYRQTQRSRRDLSVMLLVDVSGSTDGWIAGARRIIDVEREALLLVCEALEGLQAPYSVQAFSGEGPDAVVVRSIKRFDERYDNIVAQRIAGIEPEHYTRAGAALRHATMLLMREAAEHRLLLLLSDGKPSDVDAYEGRYGVEDMRQAVAEARLQGISTFCLTVDRQAAGYLPGVFGAQHYALLDRPERLPTVLVDWLRRLVLH